MSVEDETIGWVIVNRVVTTVKASQFISFFHVQLRKDFFTVAYT